MKIIYGTTNESKVQHMQDMLGGLDIEIVGLSSIGRVNAKIDESGSSPLENAAIKARAYFAALKAPVFSCDTGLYIEGLTPPEQPGVYIRRVNGSELTDEELLAHFSQLAKHFGGSVRAKYRNAICLIINEKNIYQYDGEDIASEEFLIVSEPHPRLIPGFPLDSLSVQLSSGRYYLDLEQKKGSTAAKSAQAAGFRNFFERVLLGGR